MLSILLVVNLIADYFLQNREVAEKKSIHIKYLLFHGIIIFFSFLLAITLMVNMKVAFMFATIYSVIHCVQDWYIWRLYKRIRRDRITLDYEYWKDSLFYSFIGTDMTLHIITIIILMGLLL